MEQKEEILTAIRETCSMSREVKGSMLGAALKLKFPMLNLRDTYGGLRKFVSAECADFLSFSHKQGGDDVFSVTDSTVRLFASDPSTVWRIFGNPNETGDLFYHAESSTILLEAPGSKGTHEGAILVPRITHEEQKTLIHEFAIAALGGEELGLIDQALGSKDYWQLSVGIFKASRPSRIFDFVEFRKSQLLATLQQRLIAAGATEFRAQAISKWVEEKKSPPMHQPPEPHYPRRPDRQTILDLVARMSDEELDELKLPIRTVANLVSRLSQ